MNAERLLRDYWDDLPRELKVELLTSPDLSAIGMVNLAAKELDLDIDFKDRGNLNKSQVAEFVIALLDDYAELEVDDDG